MSVYEELEIRPVINACATLTRLGGSRMPPEVLTAMNEAARCFVDLKELQRKVGERIAALTQNEAAYLSSGAAAGLVLATAACITGEDPSAIRQLPDLTGLKNEVVVHNTHRNGYDHAVRQVGVQVIEIGCLDKTTRAELEQVLSPRTAAVVWFQGAMTCANDLPLPEVIEIAKARNIPVMVDAAAQLPPVSNLWNFTHMGADLAIFSGGKDLRGPQSSGLILGRRDLIRACALNANPNHSIGRPMKVGKEEMLGLLAAVELYISKDHAVEYRDFEKRAEMIQKSAAAVQGVKAEVFVPEVANHVPHVRITWDATALGFKADHAVKALLDGEPSIGTRSEGDAIVVGVWMMRPGEDKVVAKRMREVLEQGAKAKTLAGNETELPRAFTGDE
jgi:L-seryl-tRNA(Ser) seleniumtransferase